MKYIKYCRACLLVMLLRCRTVRRDITVQVVETQAALVTVFHATVMVCLETATLKLANAKSVADSISVMTVLFL